MNRAEMCMLIRSCSLGKDTKANGRWSRSEQRFIIIATRGNRESAKIFDLKAGVELTAMRIKT